MNCIFLRPTTEQESLEIWSSFQSGAASGYDQITMNVVKVTVDVVIQPLTYIIDLSLSSGVVPDQMKIARIIP